MLRRRPVIQRLSAAILALGLAACSSASGQTSPSVSVSNSPTPVTGGANEPGLAPANRGGGEGGDRSGAGNARPEGGEAGEGRAAVQRLVVTVTDSAIQPVSLTAQSGLIEFDVTNQGQQSHHVTITGGSANGDSGMIAPGQSARFQGNLVTGTYQLRLDPDTQAQPGVNAQLSIQ